VPANVPYGPLVDPSSIRVGAVFRWTHDERPARILVCDDDTVMYDTWWPHLDTWGHADLAKARRGAISYYVTLASTLLTKADHLRDEPLTGDEEALHRPDLPFAVVRRPEMTWPAGGADLTAFAAAFEAADVAVAAPEVYLHAFGPGGGSGKAVRICADDQTRLSSSELMRKAAELQIPALGSGCAVDGVGVYRQGLHRGRPSFYLWGATSRLGPG
jgi:hypothetical protein